MVSGVDFLPFVRQSCFGVQKIDLAIGQFLPFIMNDVHVDVNDKIAFGKYIDEIKHRITGRIKEYQRC